MYERGGKKMSAGFFTEFMNTAWQYLLYGVFYEFPKMIINSLTAPENTVLWIITGVSLALGLIFDRLEKWSRGIK